MTIIATSINITIYPKTPFIPDYSRALKINKIDNIDLDYSLFVENEFNYMDFIGVENTDNLGDLAFDYVKKDTIDFNLTSNNSSWITYKTLKKLQNLDKRVEHTLFSSIDNREIVVSFNMTKNNIIATEVYRGALWYNIELKFTRKV